tara:strand:- start:105 stop:314 length:210 start_codon:yes stop_codon:yes gene_type:complete
MLAVEEVELVLAVVPQPGIQNQVQAEEVVLSAAVYGVQRPLLLMVVVILVVELVVVELLVEMVEAVVQE